LSGEICRAIYASHAPAEPSPRTAIPLEEFNRAFARMDLRLRATAAKWTAPFHVNDRQAAHYRDHRVLLAGDASHIHGFRGPVSAIANLEAYLERTGASAPKRP
jgi:2-polyprenyl-6-methoxyphenol hydroxylase-like FAD-dependent oxidoreductase